MQIINFQEAKARRQPRQKLTKHSSEAGNGVLELQRQYQNNAQFYNRWYDEHVIGQDKDGSWIYKDI